MATATVDRLASLAPERTINLALANSPAQFGAARSNSHTDYLILVQTGFSGLELLKLLSTFSVTPRAEEIYEIKADLGNAKEAIAYPTLKDGRESEPARLKRIHEQDPILRKAFNTYRADSQRRWDRALATSDVTPTYVTDFGVIPTDPSRIKAEPMFGLMAWREYQTSKRLRSLTRVEAFEAAADMGLGIEDDSDLFFGNSMIGIWTPGYIDNLPIHLRLAQGTRSQIRAALQGAFLASVEKYNRPLYRRRTSILPALEEQINARLQAPH